ncbi:hypothetical protein ACIBI9_60315 [Nonomuraea sp. NPDC050451]|uniref:hypothetical protein n=1 Tax=Nonomuraea sp. NPDC050451 TaxID=3364364 RepID=UPI00379E03A1
MKISLMLGVPFLAVALTACGATADGGGVASASGGQATSSAPASSSAPTDQREAALKFAQCMREHGVDMPDPSADGKIEINVPPGTPEQKVKEAHEACKEFSADLPLKP